MFDLCGVEDSLVLRWKITFQQRIEASQKSLSEELSDTWSSLYNFLVEGNLPAGNQMELLATLPIPPWPAKTDMAWVSQQAKMILCFPK